MRDVVVRGRRAVESLARYSGGFFSFIPAVLAPVQAARANPPNRKHLLMIEEHVQIPRPKLAGLQRAEVGYQRYNLSKLHKTTIMPCESSAWGCQSLFSIATSKFSLLGSHVVNSSRRRPTLITWCRSRRNVFGRIYECGAQWRYFRV